MVNESQRGGANKPQCWYLKHSDTLPRKIPTWLIVYWWLNDRFLGGWIFFWVATCGIAFNLILGHPLTSWIVVFGLVFPAVSIYSFSDGFLHARRKLVTLQWATLGKAVVTHFIPVSKSNSYSYWEFELGGGTLKIQLPGKKAEVREAIPIQEYLLQRQKDHNSMFDADGLFVGTKAVRMMFKAQAAIFGVVFGMFLTVIFPGINQWKFDFKVLGVVFVACVIICLVVEHRWKILLRLQCKETLSSKPSGLDQVLCQLAVIDLEQTSEEFQATLSLEGQCGDWSPRCVLIVGKSLPPCLPNDLGPPITEQTAQEIKFTEVGLRPRVFLIVLGLASLPVILVLALT